MGYNNLSDSGMSADDMKREATRIVGMMDAQCRAKMKPHEEQFVDKISAPWETVSVKQLFWLRDLKAKYVD